jgi:hypothetical protein
LLNQPPPAQEPNAVYPVPPPARQPKHLFHFIIRYEGAGIIDSNVVKFMKAQSEQKSAVSEPEKKETEDKDATITTHPAVAVESGEGAKFEGKKEKESNKLPPASDPPAPKKAADEKEKEDKKQPSVTSDPLTSPKTQCDKEDVKAKDNKKP